MTLFGFLKRPRSASVARERLHILLEYERCLGSQSDLFIVLREEIIALVGRHFAVDPDKVQFTVDRGIKVSRLAVDIEIPNEPTALLTARL